MNTPSTLPQTILTTLNDDCLEAVCRRIGTLKDLVNIGLVHPQFKESAIRGFPNRFKSIELFAHETDSFCMSNFERVEHVIKVFGPMFEELNFISTLNQKRTDYIFQLISKYCGKGLKKLTIRCNVDMKCTIPNFEKTEKFESLEILELFNATPRNLKVNSNLKQLNVNLEPIPCGSKYVLELSEEELIKYDNAVYNSVLTNETFFQFLATVPQLECLTLVGMQFESSFYPLISNCVPNLKKLNVKPPCVNYPTKRKLKEHMNHLSKLSDLESFYFGTISCATTLQIILDTFAKNNLHIEDVRILIERWEDSCDMVLSKSEKCLYFSAPDMRFVNIVLINVLRRQRTLRNVQIVRSKKRIELTELATILVYCRGISKLSCNIKLYNIALNCYNEILNLAKEKDVSVEIRSPGTVLEVPRLTLFENWDHLKIAI